MCVIDCGIVNAMKNVNILWGAQELEEQFRGDKEEGTSERRIIPLGTKNKWPHSRASPHTAVHRFCSSCFDSRRIAADHVMHIHKLNRLEHLNEAKVKQVIMQIKRVG